MSAGRRRSRPPPGVRRRASPRYAITWRAGSPARLATARSSRRSRSADLGAEPPPVELDECHPAALPSGVSLLAEGALDRIRRGTRVAFAPLELLRRPGRGLGVLGTALKTLRAVRHTLEPARFSTL